MRGRVSVILCGILVAIIGFGRIHNRESGVNAQERVTSAQPFRIALVDISYLFHKSREFNQFRAEFNGLVAKAEAKGKTTANAIVTKELLRRETQNYVIVYGHIEREVRRYAEQHNISLVLKFDSGRLDFPELCISRLPKRIVYHAGLDITDQILKRLNENKSDNIRPATQTR